MLSTFQMGTSCSKPCCCCWRAFCTLLQPSIPEASPVWIYGSATWKKQGEMKYMHNIIISMILKRAANLCITKESETCFSFLHLDPITFHGWKIEWEIELPDIILLVYRSLVANKKLKRRALAKIKHRIVAASYWFLALMDSQHPYPQLSLSSWALVQIYHVSRTPSSASSFLEPKGLDSIHLSKWKQFVAQDLVLTSFSPLHSIRINIFPTSAIFAAATHSL